MTATPPMRVKCVAGWAGGKRRLAARIIELLLANYLGGK